MKETEIRGSELFNQINKMEDWRVRQILSYVYGLMTPRFTKSDIKHIEEKIKWFERREKK